jgi:segregation and condensation protein A
MMTDSAPPLVELSDYQLRLPSFEGPLDVLLRLIERDQLAITEISLVAVTDQFLAHVEGLGGVRGVPATTVADFAAMGGRLVLIKSRSLLPRPPEPDEAEPDDLVRQLIEYRTVKEAARQFATWDAQARGAFARGEGIALPPATSPPRLASQPPVSLVRALRRRLSTTAGPRDVLPIRPVVTLREMVERVLGALTTTPRLRFSTVRGDCQDRHEVLTAFLAVLTLVRRRVVEAEQTELFGEITVRRLDASSPVRETEAMPERMTV